MGCDIHLYVEQRNEDGTWVAADKYEKDEDGHIGTDYKAAFYRGRNYNLFSILADVRNGRGFAGVVTGEGFVPISEPRGVPEDASPEYRAIAEQWDGDGHSHSHHTLRQLLDYDWTQTTKLQGWLRASDWAEWSRWKRGEGEGPESYSGDVWGGAVSKISAAEMDALLEPVRHTYGPERAAFAEALGQVYALAEWSTPYHDAAGSFFVKTIPRLLKLAGGTAGLDNVRIVFFFDN